MHYSKLQQAPATIVLGCPDCAAACFSAEKRHLLSRSSCSLAAPRRRAAGWAAQIQQRCKQLLGTRVRVSADGAEKRLAQAALGDALAAIERVERRMSSQREDSDLARLAREGHLGPIAVDEWTFEVLEKAARSPASRKARSTRRWAAGWPRSASCRRSPGRRRRIPAPPSRTSISAARGSAPRRPLRLDLSGLAKGFALDRAVDALRAAGVASGLVEAGGDLRVFGETTVAVGVRHPAEPRTIAVALELKDGAIATTGTHDRHRSCGRTVCQLIRPWDGEPLNTLESVSVLAEKAFEADALTKMLLFRRLRAEEHFLRRGAAGFRIDRRGRVSWVGASHQKAA